MLNVFHTMTWSSRSVQPLEVLIESNRKLEECQSWHISAARVAAPGIFGCYTEKVASIYVEV